MSYAEPRVTTHFSFLRGTVRARRRNLDIKQFRSGYCRSGNRDSKDQEQPTNLLREDPPREKTRGRY